MRSAGTEKYPHTFPAGRSSAPFEKMAFANFEKNRELDFEDLPPVECHPQQLSAVAGDRRSLDRGSVEMLHAYLAAVRRVAEFGAYEQLFSLWHAFHLPLCVLLFGAAAVHVLAVHLY